MEQIVLNVEQAAKLAGVSRPTMAAWVNQSGFPAFRFGTRWLIPRAAFESWLTAQANARTVLPGREVRR